MAQLNGKLILCEIYHKGRVFWETRLADGTDEEIIQKMDKEYFDSGWRPVTKDPMKKGKAVVIILDNGREEARVYDRETLRNYKNEGYLDAPMIIENPVWISGSVTGDKSVVGVGNEGAGKPIGLIHTALDCESSVGPKRLEYRFVYPEDIGCDLIDFSSSENQAVKALEKLADSIEKKFGGKSHSTGYAFDSDGNLQYGGIHLWWRDMEVEEAV